MQKKLLIGVKIGVVLTGSHCTMEQVLVQIKRLKEEGAHVYTIISYSVDQTDNRFYKVDDLKKALIQATGHPIINTITGAEPIGPQELLDLIVVMPATGNTIAKLASGIVDTPAFMAIKAHLRNQRPVVISISTNDALGINARNIGMLLNMKNIYFVPFGQDDPLQKANSITANLELVVDTTVCALQAKQIQPVLLGTL